MASDGTAHVARQAQILPSPATPPGAETTDLPVARARDDGAYAELCITSNFTFLTGASHPEELVTRAAELGLAAIAITDRNSLAGVVRAHSALRELARSRAERDTADRPGGAGLAGEPVVPGGQGGVASRR